MLEPNRNYVIEDDGSIHKMLFCGDADWEERPTTSIQEIRAKAIDEFAEQVKELFKYESAWYKTMYHQRLVIDISKIEEIAEQMKAGGIDG